jgi:sulfite exporter TauE/SafE
VIFLSGRLISYCALGFLAGLSADVLRRFVSSAVSMYFRPLAGAVTMLFAFLVLLNRDNYECPCPEFRGKALGLTGAFVFGLVIGLSPCVPLSALLFDIVLMSKGALDGASYAFSFGLGTFISGLITIGIITGLLVRVPASFVRSKAVNTAFKVTLAALLFLLGAGMIVDNIRF